MAAQPRIPKEPKKKKQKQDSARRAKLVIQRRTLCLLVAFGILPFLALFAQAYDLTINQNEELSARATRQQTQSTPISASRGSIYDRNGVVLARSATADTIFLDPRALQARADELDIARAKKMAEGLKEDETLPLSGQEYKDLIATTLAGILDLEEDTIYEKMKKTWSQYETLRIRADKEIGDQVREFVTNNVTGQSLQGIHIASDSKRYYPYSSLASHAIGFLDSDNRGAYGLEAIYQDDLEGSTGLVVTTKDVNMLPYEQLYDAEDGNSLQLTLDSNIQNYLERGLADMISKYGAVNGAAGIVMDPRSAAILAIASSPTYDINDHRAIYDELLQEQLAQVEEEFPPGPDQTHSDEYWEKLTELQYKQWRNKATNDTFEPGSTAKVLTLSMALEEGVVNPNSTFNCSGSITVSDARIGCSRAGGHGHQVLKQAVANSCNPAFINIGLSVGIDTFYDYMDAFGLFDKTGVDLQGDVGGIFAKRENVIPLDLACYAFGQNYNVTPLQLITAQAACINGGYLYTPYVVEKELDGDGNVVKQHDAVPIRQVISNETSATVREMLEFVVSDGTGRNGQVAGYRIGGKTGTADKGKTGDVIVSFLCFAPADDPQVIMLLTLDTPARDTGTYVSGGNMVAPTASAIMSDILPYLGIAPQYSGDSAGSAEGTVPYVVGSSRDAAAAKLQEYGFASYRTVGEGETVTDQTPLGGAIVPTGAEIILYMGEEKSNEPCKVPNVVGLSAADANRALVSAGLIMRSAGASGSDGIKAMSQSIEPGTEVAAGTVVTVQMGQTANHAD